MVKFIFPNDIARLMKKHDHFDGLYDNDIPLLMSRLDLDGDGMIGLNEFYL